jgi:hypothetical protein
MRSSSALIISADPQGELHDRIVPICVVLKKGFTLGEQYVNISDSIFSTTYKEGGKWPRRMTRVLVGKLLILNGGQRRDRTADAGLFKAGGVSLGKILGDANMVPADHSCSSSAVQ